MTMQHSPKTDPKESAREDIAVGLPGMESGVTVTVRVPGTTSNLGPGFDCLGCALGLWNEITLATVHPEEQQDIEPPHPFLQQAADLFFEEAGLSPFPYQCRITGNVPRSRGLGSSATVRVGVMTGLQVLSGQELDRELLFRLCTQLEGHPDNAAPTVYGGFHACHGYLSPMRFAVEEALKWVLLIPDYEILTDDARRVLPDTVIRTAAAQSVAGACRLTAAFATGEYESLRGAFADELHQPFRQSLIPNMHEAIAAAENAGALGGFLSGSGSTLIALTLENAEAVAEAMKGALGNTGAETRIITADNQGIQLLREH